MSEIELRVDGEHTKVSGTFHTHFRVIKSLLSAGYSVELFQNGEWKELRKDQYSTRKAA